MDTNNNNEINQTNNLDMNNQLVQPVVPTEPVQDIPVADINPEPVQDIQFDAPATAVPMEPVQDIPVADINPEPVQDIQFDVQATAVPVEPVQDVPVADINPEPVQDIQFDAQATAVPTEPVQDIPVADINPEPVQDIQFDAPATAAPVEPVQDIPVADINPEPVQDIQFDAQATAVPVEPVQDVPAADINPEPVQNIQPESTTELPSTEEATVEEPIDDNINIDTIDPQSILGEYTLEQPEENIGDDIENTTPIFESNLGEQSNLNKSINNPTNIISNYNQSEEINIDDSEGISSYEEQISNSQDIDFYTQKPNKGSVEYQNELNNPTPVEPVQPVQPAVAYNDDYNNGYQDQGYNDGYDAGYQNQDYGYDNGYQDNQGYADGYDNGYGYYQDQGYDNGYDEGYQNQGYDSYQQPMPEEDNSIIPPAKKQGNDLFSDGSKHPKTIGPEEFQRKMKKAVRPYNILLVLIYLLILGVFGYFGYSLWLEKNSFYASKEKMNLVKESSYQEKIYYKGKLDSVENYEWTSDNTAVAVVDDKGTIKGVNAGETKIKIKSKKTKQSIEVDVKVLDVDVKQFTVTPAEKTIFTGNTYTITPKVNGQTSLTIDLEFKSEDESIATVNEDGVITPVKRGHTNITVTIPGTKWVANMSVIVKDK